MSDITDLREGAVLPDAILTALIAQGTKSAWVEAMGTLRDIALQLSGANGPEVRSLPGEWTAVSLRGVARADSLKLMIVLSRQGVLGPEIVAGELLSATVKKLTLRIDALSTPSAPAVPSPSLVIEAEPIAPHRPTVASSNTSVMPPKPLRAPTSQSESVFPEPGDVVNHFAFGTCEVLKSDGDRLHLRQKDGRVKEIALAMLRVEPLPNDGAAGRLFKLERKV